MCASNSIHEEFFYTQKLVADNSINRCLDVRQMQKNIISTVTGGVKQSSGLVT